MKRFVWYKIEELLPRNEIVSFAFRDCDHGWRSEVEKPDPKTHPRATKYHGARIFIRETRDGGKTWAQVHVGGNLLRGLRYQASTGRLLVIRVDYDLAKRRPRMTHSLVVSDDGGRQWHEYCTLPRGTQDFAFIDDRKGYAWASVTIYGTSDGGEHWHKLARMKGASLDTRMEFVGADGTFYFIRYQSRQVFGIDPWQGIERAIPLPEGFEPRKLSVAKADNRLFILGQARGQWKLIVLEDHRMTSMSDIPADPEWRPTVFLHDNGILNLICYSDPSFSPFRGTRYHFLALDEQGWDNQALSGKTRFHQFGFAGTCAWAARISLLRGTREVWQRTAEQTGAGNDSGDCWIPMNSSGSQAPAG